MRTDTFLKIAEHLHTGSADGAQLGTGSLLADAVTGAKIRLDNAEYLKGRNNAGSGNINIIRVTTGDKIGLGVDLANLGIVNNVYITGRNNADGGDINMLKVTTADKIAVGADLANIAVVNNVNIQARNNADSGYISIAKVNTSDLIVIGAEIVDVQTNLVKAGATAITLADNQSSAITTAVITLGTDESCKVNYRLVRNGVTQAGTLEFTDVETTPQETYVGTSVGVTFSVASGVLKYVSTSTGNTISMTYVVIKE